MKLYYDPVSPNAHKAMALIAELGLDVELVHVQLFKGEQRSPEFLRVNPNGAVPALEDDGYLLWESNAILCYLAAKKPDAGLLPSDPQARGQVDQWMYWQTNVFARAIGKIIFERLIKKFRGLEPDEAKVAEGTAEVAKATAILEANLATREHLAGPLSVADFALAPWLAMGKQAGADFSAFPHVQAWLDRLYARPSFKALG